MENEYILLADSHKGRSHDNQIVGVSLHKVLERNKDNFSLEKIDFSITTLSELEEISKGLEKALRGPIYWNGISPLEVYLPCKKERETNFIINRLKSLREKFSELRVEYSNDGYSHIISINPFEFSESKKWIKEEIKLEEDFVKEFGDESEILFTNSKSLIRVENPCFVISK